MKDPYQPHFDQCLLRRLLLNDHKRVDSIHCDLYLKKTRQMSQISKTRQHLNPCRLAKLKTDISYRRRFFQPYQMALQVRSENFLLVRHPHFTKMLHLPLTNCWPSPEEDNPWATANKSWWKSYTWEVSVAMKRYWIFFLWSFCMWTCDNLTCIVGNRRAYNNEDLVKYARMPSMKTSTMMVKPAISHTDITLYALLVPCMTVN